MAKIKEKKSDSWKPIVQDGNISKNKKRKEKRLSKSLTGSKFGSDVSTPKKNVSNFNKVNGKNANLSLSVPKNKKERNALLSTSLPVKVNKNIKKNGNQSFSSPMKDNKSRKLSGILKNTSMSKTKNTPLNNKAKRVKQEQQLESKVLKFDEKNLKRKYKPESDDESSSDDYSDVNPESFFDLECSEGEETESELSDEESGIENTKSDVSDFITASGEDDESDEDDDEDDDGDEDKEEGESNDEEKTVEMLKVTPKIKKENVKNEGGKSVKEKQKQSETTENTKDNKKSQTKNVIKQNQQNLESKKETTDVSNKNQNQKEDESPSKFVGFVRGIDSSISKANFKNAIAEKFDPSKILKVMPKKDRKTKLKNNYFVYVRNEDDLEELLKNNYVIQEKTFVVHRARESTRNKEPTPIAFLPRVPINVPDEELKNIIEKYTGSGSVVKIADKRVNTKQQNRNVLVHFSDIESLRKIINQGFCLINDTSVVIREAYEAHAKIPIYRVVYSSVPSKTELSSIKKAIESKIGKDSVNNIRFSLHKDTFTFVVFRDEESMKKALEPGNDVFVNDVKLQANEFIPFYKRKHYRSKNTNTQTNKNLAKRQKLDNADESANANTPEESKENIINVTSVMSKKRKKGPGKINENNKSSVDEGNKNIKSEKEIKVEKSSVVGKENKISKKSNENGESSPNQFTKKNRNEKNKKIKKPEEVKVKVEKKKEALSLKIDNKKKNLKAKKNKKSKNGDVSK